RSLGEGGTARFLEEEPSPKLALSRAADAWDERRRLSERGASRVRLSIRTETAEVCGVEHIEGFDEDTYLPVASTSKPEELRRPYVEDVRVITPCRVQPYLRAGRGIDVAIVVVAVGIQVRSGGEVVWP